MSPITSSEWRFACEARVDDSKLCLYFQSSGAERSLFLALQLNVFVLYAGHPCGEPEAAQLA